MQAADTGQSPYRPPTLAAEVMVTSSHPQVSSVGLRVLVDGGNAVDAALAMAAMAWLVLPGQCGVGGDLFAIVREPSGQIWTVGGSGYGPDGGDADFYLAQGLRSLPLEGALAVAVPGAPAAVTTVHAHGATRSLAELWAPAIRAAERGVPCTAKTRADVLEHLGAIRRDPDASRVLTPGGQAPRVGQLVVHPDLAATMRLLADDPTSFYTGELAERAIELLRSGGAPFSGDEWAAGSDVPVEPAIAHRYGHYLVHQTPPPSPGWMVLQQAAICDGWLSELPWLDAESIHVMAGAARAAFDDRVERCGADGDGWRTTLVPEAVETAREQIAFDLLPRSRETVLDGDTTSVVAVDGEGRAVNLIHSLAFTFGARTTIPGTGVLLNNRLGRGAYLKPGHPNEVRPRRRPLHTLNAWVVTDANGRLQHVGNTPGGDGQVQWNMQLLSHLLDHGKDPQETVDAPRFTVFPGSDSDVLDRPDELRCESRLDATVLERLRRRGHAVQVEGPWAGGGSALVISVDHGQGSLRGAADSRQEGVALGA